ncbi:MAG: phage holin family protein [Pirellulales bacterium]
MVHQAKVNTNGKAKPAEPNVAASFSSLAHDAIELAELQAKLLRLDVQAAARNGGMSIALLVVGACLLLGCVPVALVALGEVFIAQWGWTRAGALGAAAAIGLALSAGTGAAAWYRVRTALVSLQRSRDELNRNIAWIKANLKRDQSAGHMSSGNSSRSFSER